MSANRVEYHEGAAADVRAAVLWYQKKSPKAALDFIDEINRATRIISRAPDRWPTGRAGTRRFVMWHFPFTLIYSRHHSLITIWPVAHGSRRPEYWIDRV